METLKLGKFQQLKNIFLNFLFTIWKPIMIRYSDNHYDALQ